MQIFKPLSIAAAFALSFAATGAFAVQPSTNQAQPTLAAAQPTPGPAIKHNGKYTFAELDQNHNGMLSRAELPLDVHVLRRNFMAVDFDGNGQLTPQEIFLYATGSAPQFIGTYRAFIVVNPYPNQNRPETVHLTER